MEVSLNLVSLSHIPHLAITSHSNVTNDTNTRTTGALAFTLLGVSHDEDTGSTKWLILDPHYSGVDDLVSVQGKSYMLEGYRAIPVSWRGLEAFSARSSYNLYLPQRPRGV